MAYMNKLNTEIMKNLHLMVCFLASLFLMACASGTKTSTVSNPLSLTDGSPVVMGDPFILLASDGRVYLYYSRCCYKHAIDSELAQKLKEEGKYDEIEESWIYAVEIKPDFSGAIGEPVQLLVPPYELNGPQEWESRSGALADAVTFNKQMRLFHISWGSDEASFRFPESCAALEKKGIKVVTYVSEGTAHEWLTWRRAFRDLALKLFKK